VRGDGEAVGVLVPICLCKFDTISVRQIYRCKALWLIGDVFSFKI